MLLVLALVALLFDSMLPPTPKISDDAINESYQHKISNVGLYSIHVYFDVNIIIIVIGTVLGTIFYY